VHQPDVRVLKLISGAPDVSAEMLLAQAGLLDPQPVDEAGPMPAALPAAAYSGSASTVRLLMGRGADIEARDMTWDSTPLVWPPSAARNGPWTTSPRLGRYRPDLIEAGASTQGVTLSPDNLKPRMPGS
jgi:hypothetical protein